MQLLKSLVLIGCVAWLMATIGDVVSADTPAKLPLKPAQPVATKAAWKSLRSRVRRATRQQNQFLHYIRGTGAPEYDRVTCPGQP
jgi:hypothetical protein